MNYKLNLPVHIHLGVPDSERSKRQEIRITIEFQADTEKAAQSDNIEDCPVNYQEIHDLVYQIGAQEFHLLESLHQTLLTEISTKFPQAKDLQILISKKPWKHGYVEVSGSL